MYWYGWTATAALGALVIGLVAASLPGRSIPTLLARMGVGNTRARDDRVRLSHNALVSALT